MSSDTLSPIVTPCPWCWQARLPNKFCGGRRRKWLHCCLHSRCSEIYPFASYGQCHVRPASTHGKQCFAWAGLSGLHSTWRAQAGR